MGLLTAGYFQSVFFPKNYWHANYWQKYGIAVAQAAVRQTLMITGRIKTLMVDARTKALMITARTKILMVGDL